MISTQKYNQWQKRVLDNGCELENVKEIAIIKRQEDFESYAEIYDTTLKSPEGRKVRRLIVLRGDSIQAIPVLRCEEDDEYYTVLVEQRRITDGSKTLEYVGGMIEKGESPEEACSKEVLEEIGEEVSCSEFKALLHPVSLCTSLLDEKVHFYYFSKTMSLSELNNLNMRNTGCEDEGEYIKTRIVKMREIPQIPNVSNNTLFATLLTNYRLNLF